MTECLGQPHPGLFVQISEQRRMLPRDDEEVTRSDWLDIHERFVSS